MTADLNHHTQIILIFYYLLMCKCVTDVSRCLLMFVRKHAMNNAKLI